MGINGNMQYDLSWYNAAKAAALRTNSAQTTSTQKAVDYRTTGRQAPESAGENAEPKSYRQQLLDKMEEMAENIKNGTIQPKIQTGAQAYTKEEWQKLLREFDDAEADLREEVEEAIAKAREESEKEAVAADSVQTAEKPEQVREPVVSDMEFLTGEVTKCSYKTSESEGKRWYITCYSKDGISCKEAYQENGKWVNRDLWSLPFTQAGQYEKVMSFLERFEKDANLRFAAHEKFWRDFLAGKIDEDDFVASFKEEDYDAP